MLDLDRRHPSRTVFSLDGARSSLADAEDGFLSGNRFRIHDRDPLFTKGFREILKQSEVDRVKLPAKSPNLNAYAERFVRSIKKECLSKVIPVVCHNSDDSQ